jgi:hypothetical protein
VWTLFSTKKWFLTSLPILSLSTWSLPSKIGSIFTWLWSTWEVATWDITFVSISFSTRNKQVTNHLFRIFSCMHHLRIVVHPFQRNHPQRSQTWKLGLLRKRLLENYWLRSGQKEKREQFWVDQWYSWLHGSRSYLQNESFLLSRLLCSWSNPLLDDDGICNFVVI